MRVLYLVPQPKSADRLGAYTFLDEEIHGLAAAGVEAFTLSTAAPLDSRLGLVRVKSVDARRSLLNRIAAARFLVKPIEGVPVPNPSSPRTWFRSAWLEHVAAQIVKEERIDLIHSHFGWPQGQGGAVARAVTGRPLVASLRGTDLVVLPELAYGRRQSPTFDQAVRHLLRTADRTLYFSEYMRSQGIALGARPESAKAIRKGVDLQRFAAGPDRDTARADLALGSRPIVLTVAGLIPLKGIHFVLEALARLRGQTDFTFVIVGEGPEREKLADQSVRLGISDRIMFAGRVDRATIPKYFVACDVFVLASQHEAAGNVILEAMAAGRPVVCTDAGGPAEYVAAGETGFVVSVGDVEGIAARIGALLQDPALRERFGAAGRRRAITELGYEGMVGEILDVYRDVLSARSVSV